MELTFNQMAKFMRAIGKTISKMAMELRSCQMDQSMMVTLKMEQNVVMGC